MAEFIFSDSHQSFRRAEDEESEEEEEGAVEYDEDKDEVIEPGPMDQLHMRLMNLSPEAFTKRMKSARQERMKQRRAAWRRISKNWDEEEYEEEWPAPGHPACLIDLAEKSGSVYNSIYKNLFFFFPVGFPRRVPWNTSQ